MLSRNVFINKMILFYFISVACRNSEDCSNGERCHQNLCIMPCVGHTQCLIGQACINGSCLLGCRSSKDCSSEEACINNKCQGMSQIFSGNTLQCKTGIAEDKKFRYSTVYFYLFAISIMLNKNNERINDTLNYDNCK